jgi:hypothetical protein
MEVGPEPKRADPKPIAISPRRAFALRGSSLFAFIALIGALVVLLTGGIASLLSALLFVFVIPYLSSIVGYAAFFEIVYPTRTRENSLTEHSDEVS